ncbi:MAG: glycosyltransferase family 2 protein [Pseudomonadota bacterium]|nr:hypothetical protein [Alphaproteobacteria bacterium]MCS5596931.1 glycosyltransferase family 2 protein [Alphaproteobacteria bacterium]MED5422089.1 glycosyltransferase family 2 protein [Pseudomonadota bacterium]|tara:strand:- start:1334 stop:2188 length:855 start_codon:yes stop_codon:yes gene_type:complete
MSVTCPVSVVIPFYNNKRTLVKSVESVLHQTLPPKELILLDDGSTDGGYEDIKAFIEGLGTLPTNIHLERFDDNVGVYPRRNYALDIATQPFVAFQDADDFWHLDKLKIQYPYLEADDSVHLICSVVGCYEGKPDDHWGRALKTPVSVKTLSRDWVLWRNVMVTISVIIRNNKKYRFRTDKRRGSDMGLWLSIVLSGHKALFVTTPLAFVRKPLFGAGGLSGNIRKAEVAHQRNLLDMREKGFISERYRKALSFWSYLKYLRRILIVSLRRAHKLALSIVMMII